jgi:hypothetical protein
LSRFETDEQERERRKREANNWRFDTNNKIIDLDDTFRLLSKSRKAQQQSKGNVHTATMPANV